MRGGGQGPPLSVRLCRHLVTSVSAPLGQFSTRSSSSGEFMPIPRIGCSMTRSTVRLMSAMASVYTAASSWISLWFCGRRAR